MKGHILKKSHLSVHNVLVASRGEIFFFAISKSYMPQMPHRRDQEAAEGKVQVVFNLQDLQEVERTQLLATQGPIMEYRLIQQ
jgi:hypothetical protein